MQEKRRLVGEIMISLGYASVEQIIQARYKQMNETSKRIGECLVELGYINHDQLKEALDIQTIE